MTRDEAVAEIQERLKFRSDRATEIIKRMNTAQSLLEQGRTLPWFLIEEDSPLTLLADANTTLLPTGFIREVERAKGLFFRKEADSTPTYLRKLPRDEVRSFEAETSTNIDWPRAYRVTTTGLEVYPAPSTDTTLYLTFYKADAKFDSDIENNWLKYAPYVIVGMAGAAFARTLDNEKAIAEFRDLAAAAGEALFKETIQREIANRTFVLGRRS